MADIDDATVAALRAHWNARQNKQPRALMLFPRQHHELNQMRRAGLAS